MLIYLKKLGFVSQAPIFVRFGPVDSLGVLDKTVDDVPIVFGVQWNLCQHLLPFAVHQIVRHSFETLEI